MLLPRPERGSWQTPDGARVPYVLVPRQRGGSPRRERTPVAVIPGAGDGLRTVDEASWGLAWYYRRRAGTHRFLVLSRREPIPEGFGVEQHAEDLIGAVEALAFGPAVWECNSGGGPIGQVIAARRPDLVKGLILSSTFHRTNARLREVLEGWLTMAREGRWNEVSWSSIELTFRPEVAARYRLLRPLLSLLSKPRSPERFTRVIEGLLDVDHREILPRIRCPTLVVGGEEDRIIDAELQREMAALIPDARLSLAPGFGHGNDQENDAYQVEVERFIASLERPEV